MITDIVTAATALKNGEVVIIPTETVYGIAADARNKSAVEKIYEIKKRDRNKPLQLMFPNLEIAKKYLKFNEQSEKIAKKILPGPLTIILEKRGNSGLAKNLNPLNNSLGFRIPDHPTILELLGTLGFPIVATSANISGEKDPVSVNEAISNLKNTNINYALDGGECSISAPSTVADIRNTNDIKILRNGVITLNMLISAQL